MLYLIQTEGDVTFKNIYNLFWLRKKRDKGRLWCMLKSTSMHFLGGYCVNKANAHLWEKHGKSVCLTALETCPIFLSSYLMSFSLRRSSPSQDASAGKRFYTYKWRSLWFIAAVFSSPEYSKTGLVFRYVCSVMQTYFCAYLRPKHHRQKIIKSAFRLRGLGLERKKNDSEHRSL